MISQSDLERVAAEKGQILADAAAGRSFMRSLSAKWFEQGYTAGKMGLDPHDPGLFSPEHRRGYLAAALGAVPQYVNVGGLPALYAGGSGIAPVKDPPPPRK